MDNKEQKITKLRTTRRTHHGDLRNQLMTNYKNNDEKPEIDENKHGQKRKRSDFQIRIEVKISEEITFNDLDQSKIFRITNRKNFKSLQI